MSFNLAFLFHENMETTTRNDAATIPNDLMKLTPAARLIGVHPATLYRWLADGMLPYWRVGKTQRRVSRADVLAMVRAETKQRPGEKMKPVSQHERKVRSALTRERLERFGLAKYMPQG